MSIEKHERMKHVEGLRGLAIMLVLLFHLDGAVWENGYLGVDVFLVMTGYLMLRGRMAQPGIQGGREFFAYLSKRTRRIVPPMLVVILSSVAVGALLLYWQDELFLCKLGFASCLAKANIFLRKEFDNYFASDSAFIPLLHLWYLSVTLQIYLLYAVANQLLQRLSKRFIFCILTTIGLTSLLYCYGAPISEYMQRMGICSTWAELKPVSYYETLPRLWEVLAGGLVCLLPVPEKRIWNTMQAAAGLLMICVCALAGTVPGTHAIDQLPCTLLVAVGTVLALRYTPGSMVYPLLSNRILVWLGSISFSLYLVHMPIIVFMRLWALGGSSGAYCALMLAVSLAAGAAFFHGIEKRRFPWWLVAALWVAVLLLCRAGRRSEGFRGYLPSGRYVLPTYEKWQICQAPEVFTSFRAEQFAFFDGVFHQMNQLHHMPPDLTIPLLVMGVPSNAPSCVLIGDSHAASAYAGFDVVLKQENIAGLYLASYIYPMHGWQEDCRPNYSAASPREVALLDWLRAHPEITHVIIAQRWWYRFTSDQEQTISALRLFLQELNDIGKRVVILGPTPEFGDHGSMLHYDKIYTLKGMNAAADDDPAAVCTREMYMTFHARALEILRSMQASGLCDIIFPLDALAPGESFRSAEERVIFMNDNNHMNPGLAVWLMERLRSQLHAALLPAPQAPPAEPPTAL